MKDLKRRDFLKYAGAGAATIVVGCNSGSGGGDSGGGGNPGPDPGPNPGSVKDTLNFTITDAMKEMVTHNMTGPVVNSAECYFWIFKEARFPAECPGPQIYATEGDRLRVNVTNELDGPHAFFIPGMVNTGPIAPGATVSVEFEGKEAGSYLYYDNLNAPVNRVMGLHGAFIVMPKQAASGHHLTPYRNPTPGVQALYDDFGSTVWWPGLSWQQGDDATNTPPTRQHIWLLHQASPVLFAEVGEWARAHPGQDFSATDFLAAFLDDPFINTSNDPRTGATTGLPKQTIFNRKPQYFTINGQSGHFSHDHGAITPMYRVGEPALVRILNAGLWVHSMHMHCNHFFITAINNVPQENPIWVDVFTVHPMDHVDYTIPYMKPPDVPNVRGIGRADQPLPSINGLTNTWPPEEEFQRFHPPVGTMRQSLLNPAVLVDIAQRQSPLCYPMHDHSEPSQVAQGGNYNCGLIAGMVIIGDRTLGNPNFLDFPRDDEFQMMLDLGRSTTKTGPAAGNDP
jgi:FtsP/CotA-like multicopper oxidase with cupredoxin domain